MTSELEADAPPGAEALPTAEGEYPANAASAARRPLRSDLRASLLDGAGFNVMVGMGETYFAAFVLALGLGQVAAGLVATLPMLGGAVLQLVAPLAVRRLGSYRRWIVLCAVVQSLCFVPLVALALLRGIPPWLVFVVAGVYWGAGLATGPAWNAWISTIVPVPIRPRYFALRTRISQASVVLGFIVGGVALEAGKLHEWLMPAFAMIFVGAGSARFVSACALASQSEPSPPNGKHRHVPTGEFLRRLWHSPNGTLLLYLLAVQASVQLSGPYFTPYMLKQLQLSYASYTVLVASAFLAKVISLPFFGNVAHRLGARRLLWYGGLGILPLPALWLVSNSFWFLLGLQVAGGVAWAAYELAMFLLFFETIDEDERVSVLTTFNLAHAVATVTGALAGGAVLSLFGGAREGFLLLFALSSVLRLLTLLLVLPVKATAGRLVDMTLRTLALSPQGGLDERPVLASLRSLAPRGESAKPAGSEPAAPAARPLVAGESPRSAGPGPTPRPERTTSRRVGARP